MDSCQRNKLQPQNKAGGDNEILPDTSGKKLRKHIRMLWAVRMTVFCAAAGMLCVLTALILSLVRVKTVAVTGNSRYSAAELTEFAGIAVGDELYAIPIETVREKLLKTLPYLESVSVSRSVGGMVVLTVTEREPFWRIQTGETFYLLDSGMYVLTEEKDKNASALPLLLVSLTEKPMVGRKLAVTAEEAAMLAEYAEVFENCGVETVTALDITDRYRVRLFLQDGSVVQMDGRENGIRKAVPAALASVSKFRVETGDWQPLYVNVGEYGNVSISILTKN